MILMIEKIKKTRRSRITTLKVSLIRFGISMSLMEMEFLTKKRPRHLSKTLLVALMEMIARKIRSTKCSQASTKMVQEKSTKKKCTSL